MKILVRNLPRTISETSLKTMFEELGTVQSCSLVMDQKTGGSKGFGFVEMPKVGEAKIAIKSLNGKTLDDKKIRVKKAEDRPETTPKRMGDTQPESKDAELKAKDIAHGEKSVTPEKSEAQESQQPHKHNPYGKAKRAD